MAARAEHPSPALLPSYATERSSLAGEKCERIMAEKIRNVEVRDVEADEVWSFIGGKEKRVRPEGDQNLRLDRASGPSLRGDTAFGRSLVHRHSAGTGAFLGWSAPNPLDFALCARISWTESHLGIPPLSRRSGRVSAEPYPMVPAGCRVGKACRLGKKLDGPGCRASSSKMIAWN